MNITTEHINNLVKSYGSSEHIKTPLFIRSQVISNYTCYWYTTNNGKDVLVLAHDDEVVSVLTPINQHIRWSFDDNGLPKVNCECLYHALRKVA
jgi:hypothetical protein